MLDVQISLLNYMATMHLMSGEVPGRVGNSHFVHVPYNAYRTQTGHIIVACIGDAFFLKFRDMLGREELNDEAYLQQPARLADRERIDAIVQDELLKGSADHWAGAAAQGAHSLRAGQRLCAGPDRPAGAGARHGDRRAAAQRRDRAHAGQSGQVLG
jgi:crotonobetainyl-CoA:carnitine CoA-transferase CaiB-like acyl-CoA transferase